MLLVDTGVLVATADRSDPDHQACLTLLEEDEGPLVTTAMVIAEAAYLIHRQLGALGEAALYTSITDGALRIESLRLEDWSRIGELVTTYADLSLGGTDASLLAIAERLGVERIATLDRRHFAVVRPGHVEALILVP
ncbi:MAG: type II toxin-antitoxin system VapC family toxin [Acidimicrobiia bacterium]